jgi:hypothetical protein
MYGDRISINGLVALRDGVGRERSQCGAPATLTELDCPHRIREQAVDCRRKSARLELLDEDARRLVLDDVAESAGVEGYHGRFAQLSLYRNETQPLLA